MMKEQNKCFFQFSLRLEKLRVTLIPIYATEDRHNLENTKERHLLEIQPTHLAEGLSRLKSKRKSKEKNKENNKTAKRSNG